MSLDTRTSPKEEHSAESRRCLTRLERASIEERARSVLAAAARGPMPRALAAAVCAATAVPAGQTPSESDLLCLFAAYEALEPPSALVPDGAGEKLRGYEGALGSAWHTSARPMRSAAQRS